MSQRLNIGLIGYGYWGPKLARNFAMLPDARIAAICDHHAGHRQSASVDHPGARITPHDADLISDSAVDAVVIATPAASHFDLAQRVLLAGKPVLVEKPLAISSEQAARLLDLAAHHQQVLMVDHTYAYTGAVQHIKRRFDAGDLGQLYYYDSVRANLGTFRPDVNVMWDLAVHDLAILDALLGALPHTVAATGAAHLPGQRENIAYVTCRYAPNLIAHLHVNWLSPLKIRRILIGGSVRSVCYDDPDVTVYDTGAVFAARPVELITPAVECRAELLPRDPTEALYTMAAHFVACVMQHAVPRTDGAAGLRVVRILEAADRSLRNGGAPVTISHES